MRMSFEQRGNKEENELESREGIGVTMSCREERE
jgi:hypothetical protein